MSNFKKPWVPNRYHNSRWNQSRGRYAGQAKETPGGRESVTLNDDTNRMCPYTSWKHYFPSEAYNPVSEPARLVVYLATYFQDNLGYVDLDVLDQCCSWELDYNELVNNQFITESLPLVTGIIRDNSEMFLAAAGVAFTSVLETRLQQESQSIDMALSVPHAVIRLKNIGSPLPFSSLKASLFGKFICIKGTVARISTVKPLCYKMAFKCTHCLTIFPIPFPDGRYTQPTVCVTPGCLCQCFSPLRTHKLTSTVDWQQLRIQENLSSTDSDTGRVPRTIDCELTADLVGSCVPGDLVTICGVVKVANQDQGRGKSKDKCTFTLNLRANSVSKATKKLTTRPETVSHSSASRSDSVKPSVELSTRDLYCIQTIFDQENVFKLLIHSLCPSIYGHELVKCSLLLGLFGGCQKYAGSTGHVPVRGDIHILVVGDPGLGKSQMLQAAAAVAPRGVYVCGNTSTSAGLTVTLCKESGSGDYSLEAGALVLADQGACCIDEFDKMSQQHQALLEAMEQQSISIAKAGIVCNLPARTSVLAAANPVGGHYNKAKTVAENLRLSGPLLSRFDLVFILLDKPDQDKDSLLSAHVMALHGSKQKNCSISSLSQMAGSKDSQYSSLMTTEQTVLDRIKLAPGEALDLLPPSLLRKYISYARDYVFPKITEGAAKVIQDFFIELRRKHHSSDSTPITTRQLESLIRLTEARAKMELREEANEKDALDIIEIMKSSMVDTYSDEIGVIDFTRSQHGSGMSNKAAANLLIKALQQQFQSTLNNTFTLAQIKTVAQMRGIVVKDFDSLISSLNQNGYLLLKGGTTYQLQIS